MCSLRSYGSKLGLYGHVCGYQVENVVTTTSDHMVISVTLAGIDNPCHNSGTWGSPDGAKVEPPPLVPEEVK